MENAMKPSGRLLHRRQDVRRAGRDLLSVLIAEASPATGCAALPPMGSVPRTSDAAAPARAVRTRGNRAARGAVDDASLVPPGIPRNVAGQPGRLRQLMLRRRPACS